jgi:hypothetical protein
MLRHGPGILAEIGRWLSFTRLGQLGEAVNRHDFARPETVLSEKAFTRKPLKRASRVLAILMASTLQGARTRKTLREERGYWHSDGSCSLRRTTPHRIFRLPAGARTASIIMEALRSPMTH